MSGLGALVRMESKLFVRNPVILLICLGLPIGLVALFGILPDAQTPAPELGGQAPIDGLIPSVAIAVLCAIIAVAILPTWLAEYRDKGILRRLQTTPVSPVSLLAAQVTVGVIAVVIPITIVIGLGTMLFGMPLPTRIAGAVLVLVLGIAQLFGLGLLIGAIVPSARVATAAGMMTFLPMLAFGGVWVPRDLMPATLQRVSDIVPLGAFLQSLRDVWGGAALQPLRVGTMLCVTVLAVAGAMRWFRWE